MNVVFVEGRKRHRSPTHCYVTIKNKSATHDIKATLLLCLALNGREAVECPERDLNVGDEVFELSLDTSLDSYKTSFWFESLYFTICFKVDGQLFSEGSIEYLSSDHDGTAAVWSSWMSLVVTLAESTSKELSLPSVEDVREVEDVSIMGTNTEVKSKESRKTCHDDTNTDLTRSNVS